MGSLLDSMQPKDGLGREGAGLPLSVGIAEIERGMRPPRDLRDRMLAQLALYADSLFSSKQGRSDLLTPMAVFEVLEGEHGADSPLVEFAKSVIPEGMPASRLHAVSPVLEAVARHMPQSPAEKVVFFDAIGMGGGLDEEGAAAYAGQYRGDWYVANLVFRSKPKRVLWYGRPAYGVDLEGVEEWSGFSVDRHSFMNYMRARIGGVKKAVLEGGEFDSFGGGLFDFVFHCAIKGNFDMRPKAESGVEEAAWRALAHSETLLAEGGVAAVDIVRPVTMIDRSDLRLRISQLIREGRIERVATMPYRVYRRFLAVVSSGNTATSFEGGSLLSSGQFDKALGEVGGSTRRASVLGPAVRIPSNAIFNVGRSALLLDPAFYLSWAMNDNAAGVPLRDYAVVLRGRGYSLRDVESVLDSDPNGKRLFVTPTDISDGVILDTAVRLGEGADERLWRARVGANDVLFARSLDVSRTVFPRAVLEQGYDLYAASNVFIVRVANPEILHPAYLAAFLSSHRVADLIRRMSAFGVGMTIPAWILEGLKVPLPPLEEQKEIGREYLARVDEIQRLKERLEGANNQQRGRFPALAAPGHDVDYRMKQSESDGNEEA